jgi:hypothetical protein
MRLNEFESSQPEVGDILEIELDNEIVETVIVSINRGNYIVESTSTDLLESKLNEVDPRNYDSDWDYYDAVKRAGRSKYSDDDFEPRDSGPTDDEIFHDKQARKQQELAKTAPQQRQVDGDGQAPNGERYNTLVTFTSPDNNRNKWAAQSYKDYHWGAKKVVDSKNEDGVYTLYVVDNHKHGMWKPWRDQPAEGVAEGDKKPHPKTWNDVDPTLGKQVDRMSQAEKVRKGLAHPDTLNTEQVYKVVALDKGNALKKPTKMKVKASSLEDLFSRLSANDWYPLEINGVEVIAGKRLKQGVAESVNERAEKKEKVKVYVKNPKTGRVVKVDFGEPGQLIKKSKKHRKHGKKRWNLKK